MTHTSKSALILGANGLFGLHCAQAFLKAGWRVQAQTRSTSGLNPLLEAHDNLIHHPINLHQHEALLKVARDCDLIINALNPTYGSWESEVPKLTASVLSLAKSSGARVLIPGNVYNFGAGMPERLKSTTPQTPTNQWGELRVEMEEAYRDAAKSGVRTIILRIGSFFQREESGNWFDTHMISGLKKGKFAYPGNPNVPHAHGYLPDAARAAVGVAELEEKLPAFTDIPFHGTTLTGNELARGIAQTLGHPIKLTTVPWPIIRFLAMFRKDMRGVMAMRYLWNTPHQLDDHEFSRLLPDFKPTPTPEIIKDIVSRYA